LKRPPELSDLGVTGLERCFTPDLEFGVVDLKRSLELVDLGVTGVEVELIDPARPRSCFFGEANSATDVGLASSSALSSSFTLTWRNWRRDSGV
jgi:hypothetical protein